MQWFESIISEGIDIKSFLICLGCAFLCGLITALASAIRSGATKSFLISLVLLPMIVYTVITMVNGNIGTGVAVMGAFSLVRFRSVPGKAKDIAAIFLAMTSGLACSGGYVALALLFTFIVSAEMVALGFLPFADERALELRITIPESLQYADAFEDLFKAYTKKQKLIKVKTTNMGSLYILTYRIEMKDRKKTQEFIDHLRCRNGNLEISIAESAEGAEVL